MCHFFPCSLTQKLWSQINVKSQSRPSYSMEIWKLCLMQLSCISQFFFILICISFYRNSYQIYIKYFRGSHLSLSSPLLSRKCSYYIYLLLQYGISFCWGMGEHITAISIDLISMSATGSFHFYFTWMLSKQYSKHTVQYECSL